MTESIVVMLGFLLGFIGWYSALTLAGPLSDQLTKDWPGNTLISRLVVRVSATVFLLSLVFCLFFLLLTVIGPETLASRSQRLRMLGASFCGLTCFLFLPRIEVALRR